MKSIDPMRNVALDPYSKSPDALEVTGHFLSSLNAEPLTRFYPFQFIFPYFYFPPSQLCPNGTSGEPVACRSSALDPYSKSPVIFCPV
jgi:hypothetical protein